MEFLRSSFRTLPSDPGVYVFLDNTKQILYVGKAKDLKSRVSSYFTKGSVLGTKTRVMISQVATIRITIVESELESLLLEAFYIQKYKPRYNVRMVDNKTYPLICITTKDQYPAIFLTRRVDNPKASYFGPYPNVGAMRLVLKTIRRVFPFQSTTNHPKRICLYNHLGLCPCPPMFDTPKLQKEYKANIRSIIRILEGESQKIKKEFEKRRLEYSESEAFEKAQDMQHKIAALSIITEQSRSPIEYDLNPNLRVDLREQELTALQEILNANGCPIGPIQKIECYDISNIQGKHAVGSMVVFVNGEKEKSLYRKYKIQRVDTPNDFASMEEVLTRRLKHTEWEYPDLIIVDGGKGQITSALKAFAKYNLSIPLIGLAKREETIIIPQVNKYPINTNSKYQISNDEDTLGNFKFNEVLLPKNTKALHLVMRLRDEAHRFAITYHRNLRSKAATAE